MFVRLGRRHLIQEEILEVCMVPTKMEYSSRRPKFVFTSRVEDNWKRSVRSMTTGVRNSAPLV